RLRPHRCAGLDRLKGSEPDLGEEQELTSVGAPEPGAPDVGPQCDLDALVDGEGDPVRVVLGGGGQLLLGVFGHAAPVALAGEEVEYVPGGHQDHVVLL